MTIPVRGTVDNASKIAAELDDLLTNFYNNLKAWRERIATSNGTDSWDAAERYQEMTSLRVQVEQRAGAGQNTGGISAAYIRGYPDHQGGVWQGGQEWAATRAALDPLITMLRDNWPEKTATGKPAYRAFHPTNYQLVSFNVPFAGQKLTNLLNQIDAVLATFTPV
jgi:hypothetical protein